MFLERKEDDTQCLDLNLSLGRKVSTGSSSGGNSSVSGGCDEFPASLSLSLGLSLQWYMKLYSKTEAYTYINFFLILI